MNDRFDIEQDDFWRRLRTERDPQHRVKRLTAECIKLYNNDPRRALMYVTKAYAIARARGDRPNIALCELWIGTCHHFMHDATAAIPILERAAAKLEAVGDIEKKIQAVDYIGRALVTQGKFGRAIGCFREALAYFRERGNDRNAAVVLSGLATAYDGCGDSTSMISTIHEALKIWIRENDLPWQGRLLAGLGMTYYRLQDFDRAIEHFVRSLELTATTGRPLGPDQAEVMLHLGILYREQGEHGAASRMFEQAMEIFERTASAHGQARLHLQFADLCIRRGEVDAALERIDRAERILDAATSTGFHAQILEQAGHLLRLLGLFDRARTVAERGLHHAREIDEPRAKYALHKLLAELLERSGDTAGALRHFRNYIEIRERIDGEEVRDTILEMQERFGAEQLEREREILALRNGRLQLELERHDREFAAIALHAQRRDALLERLGTMVRSALRSTADDPRCVLRDLLHEIEREADAPTDYRELTADIGRVQQEFTQTLLKLCPRLTAAELRICALLRGNLASKEIADLLSVSTRNVETHRYNIRKKMNLAGDVNLATYLASL